MSRNGFTAGVVVGDWKCTLIVPESEVTPFVGLEFVVMKLFEAV
jgi:hypothetical protein